MFEKMMQAIPAPIFIIQDRCIQYANSFMELKSGFTSRELFSMDPWECAHPTMREMFRKEIMQLSQGGPASLYRDVRFVTKGGEEFIGDVTAAPVIYRGRPAIMVFICDTTERKQAEKALKESQSKYGALFHNATDAVLLMNGKTIVDCNKKVLEMFRCERDEIVGMTPFDLSPSAEAADRPPARTAHQRLSAALCGAPQHFEWKHRRFDGTLFDAEVNLARIEFDGAPFLHCTLRDITDRKRRDEALRESEHKFRDLAEKSLAGIYLIQDGLFRYVNSRFAEILGYKADEMIETINHEETILPEDRAAVLSHLRKRESGEIQSMHHTFRIVTKEGEVRNVEVFGSRTIYRGRPAVIGTLLDVTERTRAEELLKQAEAELRAKSSSLEETNSALRVLLSNMEEAKRELEENVVSNIRVLVMPHIKKLGRSKLAGTEKAHVDAIESGLKNVASPFLRNLGQFGLTPTEIQVARHVRDGRTTKEIIELMQGTKDAIDMHRYHIRKKLGINRIKTNLRSYLLSLH